MGESVAKSMPLMVLVWRAIAQGKVVDEDDCGTVIVAPEEAKDHPW